MIYPVADRNTVSESRAPALRVNVGACFSRGAPTFILYTFPGTARASSGWEDVEAILRKPDHLAYAPSTKAGSSNPLESGVVRC